ncbi:OVARIAN TUMOR DOMAIN-containing deubiquitinating enzyme 11 isoform X1 [Vitis vinifera]|uniref:OVARIAN TUMOR DOMAIN-containing deubiquitinating enzyme 11 isoform X1 n=1 Tax=Vitis vinifera TaxID=29760 RepID=UPI0028830295|nr:OVARIAN TUMOR DOMAIN-containing deubiquitinating enzyme 11 isoform X1 [Vitis vinifera]
MTENYGHTSASGNASSHSSSSLNSSLQDTEDDQTIARILAEEESLKNGNKLGKRLSHLNSIPHTPRVNGEIPDVNDATLDHERLAERLATYDLAELQIEGDGNCQFRALADQLFRNPDYHKHVRKKVVKQIDGDSPAYTSVYVFLNILCHCKYFMKGKYFLVRICSDHCLMFWLQLKHFRKLYESYVPMKYRSYLKQMKKSGEWGDHLTLQAAADRFGAKICLITSFRDTCFIEINPRDGNPTRELWLSFWSEVHYNSLYASGDVPSRAPRKRHWLF